MKKSIILFFGLICCLNFKLYSVEAKIAGESQLEKVANEAKTNELPDDLFHALSEEPIDAEKIEKIINAGPNINKVDPETGFTPFTNLLAAIAIEYKEGQPIPEKFIKIIKLFLEQKSFDVNLPDQDGVIPFTAVMEFFHFMIKQGINKNNQDIKEIVKLFLNHGANVNLRNKYFAYLVKNYKIFTEAFEEYLHDLSVTKPEDVCVQLAKLEPISEENELLSAYVVECEFRSQEKKA